MKQQNDKHAIKYHNNDFLHKSINSSNQIIQRKPTCPCGGGCPGCVQAKLKISQPDDVYEKEADRIADQVVNMSDKKIQRKCSACEMGEEEEMTIHRKAGNDLQVSDDVAKDINSIRSGGAPLDSSSKEFMEHRFRFDFSKVRIHNDSKSNDLAESVNAKAFTFGNDVFFGKTESIYDKKLMAHELTHVIQQNLSYDDTIQRAGNSQKISPKKMECDTATDLPSNIVGYVSFAHASSVISDEAKPIIHQFIKEWWAAGHSFPIQIDGFASIEGTEEFNWNLSCERAKSVVREFISPSNGALGIPPSFITHFAQGATTHFSTSSLPHNRRVTVSALLPHGPPPVKNIMIWINSFIPMKKIPGPPLHDCFLGDDRGFDTDLRASSRTHQVIKFDASTLKVLLNESRTGITREVKCDTLAPVDTGHASKSGLLNFAPVRMPNGDIQIKFETDASDPLVSYAPSINVELTIDLDLSSRVGIMTIQHDGFPAYEVYIMINEANPPITLLTYDPIKAGETAYALFPPMDKGEVNVFTF